MVLARVQFMVWPTTHLPAPSQVALVEHLFLLPQAVPLFWGTYVHFPARQVPGLL